MRLNWFSNMTVFWTLSLTFKLQKVFRKHLNLWMTLDIFASKRHRRYLEPVWHKTPTVLNRSRLTRQTHLCNRQMSEAKSAYYSEIIAEHSGDHRSLWKAFHKILHRCSPSWSFLYWRLASKFSSLFTKENFYHSCVFLWLMFACAESSSFQEGLGEPNLCYRG